LLSTNPADWFGTTTMDSSRGRALLLERSGNLVRVLVPIVDVDEAVVRFGVQTTDPIISVAINGAPAPDAQVSGSSEGTSITGPWRRGWNIVTVTGLGPLEPTSITVTRTPADR
jgi:hypothetical protein